MQEEVTQKTIALVIKTAKLDANVLKAAMRMYLNHRRQKGKGQILRSTPNTAPLICGAYNTQPEGLLTTA